MNTIKKICVSIIFVAAMGGLLVAPMPASADHNDVHTIDQLTKLIAQLQAQIVALTQHLPLPPLPPTQGVCPVLTYNLYLGHGDRQTEGQVTALQKFLAQYPDVYPDALITGYFGPLTEQAVQSFQRKHNIVSSGSPETTGYGVVGPATRAKIRELCGKEPVPPPLPPLTVTEPNGGELWDLQRTHTIQWIPYDPQQDLNFGSEMSAYLEKVVNRDFVTVGRIIAGGKASIHWAGEIDVINKYAEPGDYYIRVVNNQTNQWDRSDASFKLLPPPIAPDLKIDGSDGPITIPPGGKNFTLLWTSTNSNGCRLNFNGLADDIKGLPPAGDRVVFLKENSDQTFVHLICTTYTGSYTADYVAISHSSPQVSTVRITSPNGGETLPHTAPHSIQWNFSHDIYKFSIALYKNDAFFRWIVSDLLWSGPGMLSWNPSSVVPNGEIGGQVFKIYIIGYKSAGGTVEDKSDAPFSIVSPGSTNLPPTISGVSGPTNLNIGQSGTWTVNARDPEGGTLSYSVAWGDESMPVGGGGGGTSGVQTASFTHTYTRQGVFNPTFTVTDSGGLSERTSVSVNVGGVVQVPSLHVQVSSASPIKNTVVAGMTNAIVAVMDMTVTGEPVQISELPFLVGLSPDTMSVDGTFTNVSLYDENKIIVAGPKDINSNRVVFTDSFIVPVGFHTYTLRANVSTYPRVDQTQFASVPSAWIAKGMTSGKVIIPSSSNPTLFFGPITIVKQGSFSVSLDLSSPVARTVQPGAQDVVLSVFRINGVNEPISLRQIAYQFDGSNVAALQTHSIWDGQTKLWEGFFTGLGMNGVAPFSSPVVIPANSSKAITFKGTIAPQGIAKVGDIIAINYDGDNWQNTKGVGQFSGNQIYPDTRTDIKAPWITIGSASSVVYETLPLPSNVLVNGLQILYRFKATAQGNDAVVSEFQFITQSQGVSVNDMKLYAYSDPNFVQQGFFSQPVGNMASLQGGYDAYTIVVTNNGASLGMRAGTSYYFELRVNALITGSTASVTTRLNKDGMGSQTLSGGTSQPSITVLSPNGGEIFTPGSSNKISWTGGKDVVQVGLVKESATNNTNPGGDPYLIIGWINTNALPNSSIYWDAKVVYDLHGNFFQNVIPGRYKIIVVTKNSNGEFILWDGVTNRPGVWDVSDAPFTITSATPVYERLAIPSNVLSNGDLTLYRFKATASGNITIPSFDVNLSNSGAQVSNLRLYAYSDPYFSAAAYSINPVGSHSATYTDGSRTVTINVNNLPLPAGTPRYFSLEGSTAINQSSAYVTTSVQGLVSQTLSGGGVVARPDLAVTDIYDDVGKLSVKISNIGNASAPSNIGHLYIWIDDQLVWTYSLGTLANQSFLTPGGVTVVQSQVFSGSHKIKAHIDPNNVITESNESNNVLEKTLTLLSPDTTPPIISAIYATPDTPNSENINWSTNEVADTQVDYGTTMSYGQSYTSAPLLTLHPVHLINLSPGTLYHYRVKSKDAAGNVGVSNDYTFTTLTAPDTTPPSTPTNFNFTVYNTTGHGMSWSASTDPAVAGQAISGVSGYSLERCIGASCTNFVKIASPTITSYTDSGLAAGTTYRYSVRAADVAGNTSGYSAIISRTTDPAQPPPDTTPPSTPTNLTATFQPSSQINLSWTASTDPAVAGQATSGVTGYRVERCEASTACTNFVQIATPATNSYSNTGVIGGIIYRYRVRAADAAGNLSGYVYVSVSATTPPPSDTTAPSAPSGLIAEFYLVPKLSLTWNASTDNVGVSAYRVERCTGTTCTNFVQIGTISPTPTFVSYVDSTAANGTAYRWRVRAQDAAGNLSGYSNIVTETPVLL